MEPFWVVSSEVFFGKVKILYQNKITLLTNTHKLTFVEGFVGYAVAQFVEALRATSRKVAGSSPDGVTGIFQ